MTLDEFCRLHPQVTLAIVTLNARVRVIADAYAGMTERVVVFHETPEAALAIVADKIAFTHTFRSTPLLVEHEAIKERYAREFWGDRKR